jgi:hypothetical protein
MRSSYVETKYHACYCPRCEWLRRYKKIAALVSWVVVACAGAYAIARYM